MAEDRMLSDEILLGLIKANSVGGGGGTANYNDLSNKPQIGCTTMTGNKSASDLGLVAAETGKGLSSNNYTDEDKAIVGGVTAALADKADKSAVKNEFIGTLAQWNALTAEQKKAYDTYQITDDYSEGSGGLPNYSTAEQKTGQKWIDGKEIYFKTYTNIRLTSGTIAVVDSNFGSSNNVVDIKCVISGISSGIRHQYITTAYNEGGNFSVFPEMNGDSLQIVVRGDWSNYSANIVIYYTKTN
jgi:hypothetical protein